MIDRRTPLAILAALLLAFGIIAIACGGGSNGVGDTNGTPTSTGNGNSGGDALTLEQYFLRIEESSDAENARGDALDARLDEELVNVVSEQQAFDLIAEILAEQIASFETFVNELDDLSPPDELASTHDEAIAALRVFLAAFDDVQSGLDDLDSLVNYESLFATEAFIAAASDADQSCFALQDAADENGIDVDLDCDVE